MRGNVNTAIVKGLPVNSVVVFWKDAVKYAQRYLRADVAYQTAWFRGDFSAFQTIRKPEETIFSRFDTTNLIPLLLMANYYNILIGCGGGTNFTAGGNSSFVALNIARAASCRGFIAHFELWILIRRLREWDVDLKDVHMVQVFSERLVFRGSIYTNRKHT